MVATANGGSVPAFLLLQNLLFKSLKNERKYEDSCHGAQALSALLWFVISLKIPDEVRVMDCLTYAGNLESGAGGGSERYSFSQTDITDAAAVAAQFSEFRPDIVMHRRQKAMWTVPLMARRLHPDQRDRHLHSAGGGPSLLVGLGRSRSRPSASIISPLMRCTATCMVPMTCSPKKPRTRRAARTPPPKRAATIWFAHGIAPTVCRWW